MIKVNLLPVREARRRADLRQQGLLLGVLVALALGGVAYVHYSKTRQVEALKARVAETEKQIDRYAPQLKQVEAFKKKKAEVERKLEVIRGLEKSRSGPVRILEELATKTPERVWLTELTSENQRLELKGMSLDNEVIATFLTRLEESPYFSEVELEETELQGKGELKLNRFVVGSTLVNPETSEDEAESGGKKNQAARAPRRGPALSPVAR